MKTLSRQWALPLVALGCVATLLLSLPVVERADADYRTATMPHILIDPGHGGADGGATGADGTQEKAVNLAISRTLRAVLHLLGFDVVMTREDDRSIHDSDAQTLREQKVSDMHNRLAMYEQATLVVSIHQNQFSQSQYSGTQVFWSPGHADSERLAGDIREAVLALLQPENTRALKRADDSLFLLANTTVPTALVECGFLSNPAECAQLADANYQRQMAFAVARGVALFAQS